MHNAASERRPLQIKVVWEHPHAAVPTPPEDFDGGIPLGVVAKGVGGVRIGGVCDELHQLIEEFRGRVGM